MKKYIKLFYVTFVLVLCAVSVPVLAERQIPIVETKVIEKNIIEEIVVCSGIIEQGESEEVVYDIPFYPQSVNVSQGDEVKKGDLLLSVDKEQTMSVLAAANLMGGLSDKAASYTSFPNEVYSPVSGKVVSVNASVGQYTSPSTPLFVISNSDSKLVKASVSETQIADVEVGQEVKITGSGFKGTTYKGKIESISSSARQTLNGTAMQTVVDVIVSIENADEKLKSGFTTKLEIVTSSGEEKIIVPYEAVNQDENNNEFVYVYENSTAIKKFIQTGEEFSDGYEIVGGINENDLIIIDTGKIKEDGAFVKLQEVA